MARKMKDSGIEWLGNIPADWYIVRLRYLCQVSTGNKDTINRDDDGQYPFYVRSPIVEKINSYSYDGEAVLMAGDGVGAGKVFHYANGKFDYHQRVYNIYGFKGVKAKYLYYYLMENFRKEIEQSNAKSTVDSIRLPMLLDFPISVGNKEKQQAIADYLDRKCSLIDSTIEKQKAVIEKVKLYKQSIITEAVTKGLDPNVTMKPSGIELIGDIPVNWDVVSLGYEVYVRARLGWKGLKAEEYVDDGYIFLATPNIKDNNIDFNNVNYISKQRYEESPEIMLSEGDVLLTKDGSTLGTVNVLRYLPKEATVNSSIAVLTPSSRINSIYLYYLIKSEYIQTIIQTKKDGMGVPHLFQKDIKKFTILVPPILQQQNIANYLDCKCNKIDGIISSKQTLIDKLTEYKKSLIYECVTGKREVV